MIPYIRGKAPLQAHVGVPEGLCEEEFGRSGFYGRYAHLYRSEPMIGWSRIEGNLKPRAYQYPKPLGTSPAFPLERFTYLENQDVRIQFGCIEKKPDYFFRNADGDEVLFVHEGKGRFLCDFGTLSYRKGDYLVVPRGTMYQFDPEVPTDLLIIESASEIKLPDKGMLGQHALIDPAAIQIPELDFPSVIPQAEYELVIKRQQEHTRVYYPFYPLNTISWKGTLTVWQINVEDIRPISCDRFHLPPSAHTTFVAQNFVICSFLPRPLENGDPKAVKVPFYHSNIDYDEVLFYHAGEFFSRAGIGPGMVTFHPQGIHHGPQRNAVARSKEAKWTNEIAVMIDTRNPLRRTPESREVEVQEYWKSWQQ